MTSDSSAAGHTDASVRTLLRAVTDPAALTVALIMISDHRSAFPILYDVPISSPLAGQLLDQVAESASAAVAAELRRAHPGFTPSPHQWVYTQITDGPLAELDRSVLTPSHEQYERGTEFGRRNVLALRITGPDGGHLARVYQGFSPEKSLSRTTRILGFWTGEQFGTVDDQPLVIDRNLRLFVFGDLIVLKNNSAYEALFGALPDLRELAAATFAATLGTLRIVGGDELQAACGSDINMMRKLLSIRHKMARPGYADALTMPNLLTFLQRSPHIDLQIDRSGDAPALVYQGDAQHRWALLKLLDDDFLRSDLTDINYEANSKSEVPTD